MNYELGMLNYKCKKGKNHPVAFRATPPQRGIGWRA